jgi:putative ABC transport system substrate-binding protein
MKRRSFISLLGGAAAWPRAARAEQAPMPVVGYLSVGVASQNRPTLDAFRRMLAEAGYIEGRTLTIEYRFAEGRYDRLPEMAAELARRNVALIVAVGGTAPALAAKAATATTPIVFLVTDDPVALGLVESFAHPGGNATGVNFPQAELGPKQLGLLREIAPSAGRVGLLINPNNTIAEGVKREVVAAASAIGVEIQVVQAGDSSAIEAAVLTLVRNAADALLIGADPFFFSRRVQLATLAARHKLPSIYNAREFADVGGLMSYGASLVEAFRQGGAYAARILKGARPADLPVVRSVTFELVINVATARALGLEVPPLLLARADEVIE